MMFGFLRRKAIRKTDKCAAAVHAAEAKLEEAFRTIDSSVREKRIVRRSARMASQKAANIPHLAMVGSKR